VQQADPFRPGPTPSAPDPALAAPLSFGRISGESLARGGIVNSFLV
jgi:hypothetical protein